MMTAVGYFHSPVGWLRLQADDDGLTRVDFVGAEGESSGTNDLLRSAEHQLREYFARERRRFDLPLKPSGTDFQTRVWAQLRAIDFGNTRSYGELASAIGQPGAARAVGGANNKNPISIIVPCHRVIGANGSLVGFGGGLERKQWLLDFEQGVQHLDVG